jgi:hypothetical protein
MYFTDKQLLLMFEAFAKLVAQHEREACANVCAEFGIQGWDCVDAIRARGQA